MKNIAVIGAGIVGLAHAWSAAKRGHGVTVYERSPQACGASIRNFGMIWPIGQPAGELYRQALVSRQCWLDVAQESGLWVNPCGSIHLAHRPDEWQVLQEFAERAPQFGYACVLLSPAEVQARTPAACKAGLLGGLFSPTELAVNPRRAIPALAHYLSESCGVRFFFGQNVTDVQPEFLPQVCLAGESPRIFDRVIVCGGVDVAQWFPDEIAKAGLRLCKLQMMRTGPQPQGWRIGPHLASGLTLRHYRNFEICPSLPALKNRIAQETPELDRFGIHVMASQNDSGEVILGDSHEYDGDVEPFDKAGIDELILAQLRAVLDLRDWSIAERWHGLYVKHPNQAVWEQEPFPEIHLCTGTGGSGMTMAFGIAEGAWERWSKERSF